MFDANLRFFFGTAKENLKKNEKWGICSPFLILNAMQKRICWWFFRKIAVSSRYKNKDEYKKMQINAMSKDFSWNLSAQNYIKVYTDVLNQLQNKQH